METIVLTDAERMALSKALENEYCRVRIAGGDHYGPAPVGTIWTLKNLIEQSNVTLSCKPSQELVFRENLRQRNAVLY